MERAIALQPVDGMECMDSGRTIWKELTQESGKEGIWKG